MADGQGEGGGYSVSSEGEGEQTTTKTTTGNNNGNINSSAGDLPSFLPAQHQHQRPHILITDSSSSGDANHLPRGASRETGGASARESQEGSRLTTMQGGQLVEVEEDGEEEVEVVDGIKYRIVAAVTAKPRQQVAIMEDEEDEQQSHNHLQQRKLNRRNNKENRNRTLMGSMRRKSSAFVSSLVNSLGPQPQHDGPTNSKKEHKQRRLSIYELTKSPPPETSLEIYLSERRRSSTVSSKQAQQQQLEQQSTFETNYCQRQQYFKDLNQKLINHDRKLLNVVANRGQIHRHSVDIAQLPLDLAAKKSASRLRALQERHEAQGAQDQDRQDKEEGEQKLGRESGQRAINQFGPGQQETTEETAKQQDGLGRLRAIREDAMRHQRLGAGANDHKRGSTSSTRRNSKRAQRIIIRKFQKLDNSQLSSDPAPDVKIGQRVAYKEYYGNEFGTIRWIGRVPQICPDWTAGVEFDNAIGEGDGSLNGRRYFIAKDCFAKFLPLSQVALVDQHVGRPEPGTMISVMSAAVRPGQMISIQRVSTVHVQHCFLNAPHQIPGADILAVNTRLHCQCPNCGPCAHVIKPPRTQRLARSRKNATHMCQFSTYTCCGMQSQEEALCTYTGNKAASALPPPSLAYISSPSMGHSWTEGAGYLSQLQAQQSKLMPEEYKIGAAPEDIENPEARRQLSRSSSSRRGSGRQHQHQHHRKQHKHKQQETPPPPVAWQEALVEQQPQLPNDQLALACQDKIVSYDQEKPHDWLDIPKQEGEGEDDYDIVDNNSNNNNKQVPKSAKVVYRDSIENRYLFPTDEPIDSTLEADLENLSQARYGPGANQSRLNGGSRNIFKSLRSLVSCLSAQQSKNSDIYDYDHSENTFRFSHQYGEKANNKSIPTPIPIMPSPMPVPNTTATGHQSSPLILETQQHPHSKRPQTAHYFIPTNTATTTTTTTIFGNHHHHNHPEVREEDESHLQRHISSSSDCGFSSGSKNSILGFSSNSKCSPVSLNEERKRRQIYQNFISQLMFNTSMKNEDLIRLKRALFESQHSASTINCCVHQQTTTTAAAADNLGTFESDHTTEINLQERNILDQDNRGYCISSSSGCCRHSNAKGSYCRSNSDRVLDRTLKRRGNDNVVGEGSSGRAFEITKPIARSIVDGSSISGSVTLSSYDESNSSAINGGGDSNNNNHNLTSMKQHIDERTTSGLPKAFELKLTLSINSDTNKTASPENFQNQHRQDSSGGGGDEGQLGQPLQESPNGSNQVNSTFNINIMSDQKDGQRIDHANGV